MNDNLPVLVVDDEEGVRTALIDILEVYGYPVIAAASGDEAIRVLADLPGHSVQVAIVDLVMPGLNGVATMQKLRAINPSTKFVISSGFDEHEIVERFDLAAFDRTNVCFLQKPFSLMEIRKLMEGFLRGAGG